MKILFQLMLVPFSFRLLNCTALKIPNHSEGPYTTVVTSKSGFHSKNRHRDRYDFDLLTKNGIGELKRYVHKNKYGDMTIDFSDQKAVLALNKAILSTYYKVPAWDIPDGYLCPPVPSRVDYIHHISDLISSSLPLRANPTRPISILDIGTGANVIYPLLGFAEYGWRFVGVDVDIVSIESAKKNILANKLQDFIEVRLQKNPANTLVGCFKDNDFFHCSICNPPFHSSLEESQKGSIRKWRNLEKMSKIEGAKPVLNFGGSNSELIYNNGGELGFLQSMIQQSSLPKIKDRVLWFTALVSKESTADLLYRSLSALTEKGLVEYKKIEMAHGHKKSRIVAWTFQEKEARKKWF